MTHRYGIIDDLFDWLQTTLENYKLGYVFWILLGVFLVCVAVHGVREYKKNRKEINTIVDVRKSSVKRNISGSEIGDIVVFYDRSICKIFGWISFFFLVMFLVFTVLDLVYSVENARENSYVMLVIFVIVQLVRLKYEKYRVEWKGEKLTIHRFLRGIKVYNISDIDTEVKTDNWYQKVMYVNGKKAFKVNLLCINSELFDRKLETYGKVIKKRGEK